MNYDAQVLSNKFKVKDKELVKRLLGSAGLYMKMMVAYGSITMQIQHTSVIWT